VAWTISDARFESSGLIRSLLHERKDTFADAWRRQPPPASRGPVVLDHRHDIRIRQSLVAHLRRASAHLAGESGKLRRSPARRGRSRSRAAMIVRQDHTGHLVCVSSAVGTIHGG
jgi:hypothetical protein